MTTLSTLVLARLATIPGTDRLDGGILKTPTRPYFSVSGGVRTATEQRYGDSYKRVHWSYSVKVVNISAEGCRDLSDTMCALLNDPEQITRPADGMWSAFDYASDLITEDQVEGDWRYSITAYFIARTEEHA